MEALLEWIALLHLRFKPGLTIYLCSKDNFISYPASACVLSKFLFPRFAARTCSPCLTGAGVYPIYLLATNKPVALLPSNHLALRRPYPHDIAYPQHSAALPIPSTSKLALPTYILFYSPHLPIHALTLRGATISSRYSVYSVRVSPTYAYLRNYSFFSNQTKKHSRQNTS